MFSMTQLVWLLVIIAVVVSLMMVAKRSENREGPLAKMFSPAPDEWAPLLRVIHNWSRLSMGVGLGMQITGLSFYIGLVVFFLGAALALLSISMRRGMDENK